ncbi:MAG: hypothetical protein AAFX85_08925 [Pseudomonadota bacterium]
MMSHNEKFRKEVKRDPKAAYALLDIHLSKDQLEQLQGNHVRGCGEYFEQLSELTASLTTKSDKARQRKIDMLSGFGVSGVAHRCGKTKR